MDGPWDLRKAVHRRLRDNPDAIKIWFGLIVFICVGLFGYFGKYVSKYSATESDFITLGGEGPSAEHWFGTTVGGNDLFGF